MIVNNGQTNEGLKYIESFTNTVPDELKEAYTSFIDYFGSIN